VTARLDDASVPHDVLCLDLDHTDDRQYFTFHPETFKHPNQRKFVVLVDPHLKTNPEYWLYGEALEQGLLLKTKSGDSASAGWPGHRVWTDLLNPAARTWWETAHTYAQCAGSRPNVFV
jgi:alpha 1,3-glucosidase